MKNPKYFLYLLFFLPVYSFAWQWMDLWQSHDQQGTQLLQAGKPQAAAQVFKDKNWQGVSHYRAGNYSEAYKLFSANKTSDGQYNAGNAAAFAGRYQDAMNAYDKSIALNPNNTDAIANREIVKKLMQQNKEQKQQNKNDDKKNSPQQKNNDQQSKQDPQKNNQQSNSQKNNTANAKQDKTSNPEQSPNQENLKRSSANNKQQRQEEDNKQLLRRISDEPGGLLQQKFLRDYLRRHDMEGNSAQGVS